VLKLHAFTSPATFRFTLTLHTGVLLSQGLSSYHWTEAMAEEATYFYFTHYRQHWCSRHLADALACIPQVMMWDDHDIFDGWGSYPHALLTCSVFQGEHLFSHHSSHTTVLVVDM